jgi:predicted Zn finger-like uncharacterized protein
VQTTCPQCQQGIVIDDSKIPDRAFSVRCPRCKATVRFQGKGAPASAAPAPPPISSAPGAELDSETMPAPPPPASMPAMTPPPVSEEVRAQLMAQLRREVPGGEKPQGGRALVALGDRAQAGTLTLTLTRQGYAVDLLDDNEEGIRLLEQGVYGLVATCRPASGGAKGDSLYQRLTRLGPDTRRSIFVVLVGDDLHTGDVTQAFTALADLVVHPRDAGTFDAFLHSAQSERQRLYQVFLDARRRFEEAT